MDNTPNPNLSPDSNAGPGSQSGAPAEVSIPVTRKKIDFKEVLFSFRNIILSTQNTIGIDVGQGYIKIVQLQKGRGGYLLTDYKVRAIPFKVKDNPKERAKFIKDFISEFIAQSKIKTTLGRLTIKGAGIFVFSFLVPPLSDKDLRGTVGIELKKRLPFQLDFKNIFYNYFVTDKFEEENPSAMVTCIAIDNSSLDKHLEFLKAFNLRPVTINIASDALGNLITAIGSEQITAVLDMGVKQSILNFYKKGLLQFSREVPVGGEQLTQGILKALAPLGVNITFEDAETFKRQCGIPMADDAVAEFYTDFGVVEGGQITTALRPILERLVTEISRTVTYYFRTYKIETIDALYITGGASRMKNIDRFLSANLNNLAIKTIEKLNPLKAIKGWLDTGVFRQELVMEEAAPHLAVAFGLCIDKGGEVNLVPPKAKIEQKALFLMFLARITFPLFLVIILGVYSFIYGRSIILKTIAKRSEVHMANLAPTIKKINDYLVLKSAINEKESLLGRAIGKQPLWWGVLKELSIVTPQEVTLHKLEVKGGTVPREINIKGEVISEYSNLDLAISQYTLNLSESPFFGNVRLVTSERDIYSPVPKANFEIACELKV